MTQGEQRVAMKSIIRELDASPIGSIVASKWVVPEGYILEKFTVKGVPVEHLIPAKKNGKTIVQMHGGGYCVALLDVYRNDAVTYSELADGAEIFTFDYRVAPTYEAPAALEDSVTVYSYLLEQGYQPDDMVFIGDSAGGNLVLATALYLRDHKMPMPAGILALSPWACADTTPASREENKYNDIFIGVTGINLSSEVYDPIYFRNADKKDPYNSPAYGDYTGFPRLLIQTGSLEVLRDDSIMVAKAAREAGVDVTQTTYENVSHDFQLAIPQMEESQKALVQIKEFMKDCFYKK